MSTTIMLGNPAPMMQVPHPDATLAEIAAGTHRLIGVPAPHLNQSVTTVEVRDEALDPEHVELTLSSPNDRMLMGTAARLGNEHRASVLAVHEVESLMAVHSGGQAPTWVSCPENPALEAAIALHFSCMRGEPTALWTNGGRDAYHAQMSSTSAQPATFNYVALTANATAPAATDTTLTAEITTASGGLIRKQATYAHTTGTNTSTLTLTFTANGSDSLPVTIAKEGVFNASTAGTLGSESLLNATAPFAVSGDSATVTITLTA